MTKIPQITLTFAVLATFWFVYWIWMLYIPGAREILIVPIISSPAVATGIGFLVWKSLRKKSEDLSRYVLVGGMVTGAVFFIAGFAVPMFLWPTNNLGPVFGLFFTGPIGFLLGLLGGGTYWQLKVSKKVNNQEN